MSQIIIICDVFFFKTFTFLTSGVKCCLKMLFWWIGKEIRDCKIYFVLYN